MFVGDHMIDRWRAGRDLPSKEPNGHTASRRVIRNVVIRNGDTIRLEGKADGGERAVLDYIEITR